MILSKNFVVFAIATLGFYVLGFGLIFSDGGFMSRGPTRATSFWGA